MRFAALALLAGAIAFAGAACGGGNGDSDSPSSPSSAGAKVFAEAGCGDCHTLKAAGTTGKTGPDLDEAKPSREKVEAQVRNGGGAMPAFEDKLSDDEIRGVAEFVSSATRSATGGESVAAAFKPDDTKLDECADDVRCYEQAFANLAYDEGPKAALDRFDRDLGTPGPVASYCHRIVHAIGAGALKHFDDDVARAFAAGRPSCTSGYYHGILERAFLGLDEDELAPTAQRLCSDSAIRRTDFIAYQCVHGLGHGLMIYSGYDLPLSLKTCHGLAGTWDQQGCTGGVFMENIQSTYGVQSRWLRRDDLIYPCNTVAERDKYYCYDLVPGRVLPVVDWNFSKAAGWCRRAERKWRATCFQGLGREASGYTDFTPLRILPLCSKTREMEHECLLGASKDLAYTDAGPRRGKELCNAAPPRHRAYCWQGIGAILASLHRDNAGRKRACDAATNEFRSACYRGAAVTR